jgi:putative membrane protein
MNLKILPAAFALAGVAVVTGLVIYFGAGDVLRALTSVSAIGFGEYIGAQLVILLGLGLCWRMLLTTAMHGSLRLCVWGRMVRDATGEFLPFSQVGGYVIGARAVTLGGVAAADATASTFADITTEFLAQLAFIGIGLVILSHKAPGNHLLVPVGIGLSIAVVMGFGLVLVQRGGGASLVRKLVAKFSGNGGEGAGAKIERLQSSLNAMYEDPIGLALAAVFHLVCWFGTATASFVGFHALGVPLSFVDAICIEAMLHAIMALAFFIPGRVGVQEAAYTVLGGIFGIPPDIALSLSLLRRARDFVIAVPVLVIWQGIEARRLRAAV